MTRVIDIELKDWFAGQIAAAIASTYATETLTPRAARKDGQQVAEAAYALAEALLLERQRLSNYE